MRIRTFYDDQKSGKRSMAGLQFTIGNFNNTGNLTNSEVIPWEVFFGQKALDLSSREGVVWTSCGLGELCGKAPHQIWLHVCGMLMLIVSDKHTSKSAAVWGKLHEKALNQLNDSLLQLCPPPPPPPPLPGPLFQGSCGLGELCGKAPHQCWLNVCGTLMLLVSDKHTSKSAAVWESCMRKR